MVREVGDISTDLFMSFSREFCAVAVYFIVVFCCRFSDELSLAKMKQSYGGASSSAAQQPKNLLTALNQSEVR